MHMYTKHTNTIQLDVILYYTLTANITIASNIALAWINQHSFTSVKILIGHLWDIQYNFKQVLISVHSKILLSLAATYFFLSYIYLMPPNKLIQK